MQINYKPVGGMGNYVVLIDTTLGGSIEEWDPDFASRPQIVELASNFGQNSSILTNTLGNLRCSMSMRGMSQLYATNAAAMAAAINVANTFLTQLLNLQVMPDGVGAVYQYYPACVFSKCKPQVRGAGITWTMDFTSQMATFTPPI